MCHGRHLHEQGAKKGATTTNFYARHGNCLRSGCTIWDLTDVMMLNLCWCCFEESFYFDPLCASACGSCWGSNPKPQAHREAASKDWALKLAELPQRNARLPNVLLPELLPELQLRSHGPQWSRWSRFRGIRWYQAIQTSRTQLRLQSSNIKLILAESLPLSESRNLGFGSRMLRY